MFERSDFGQTTKLDHFIYIKVIFIYIKRSSLVGYPKSERSNAQSFGFQTDKVIPKTEQIVRISDTFSYRTLFTSEQNIFVRNPNCSDFGRLLYLKKSLNDKNFKNKF